MPRKAFALLYCSFLLLTLLSPASSSASSARPPLPAPLILRGSIGLCAEPLKLQTIWALRDQDRCPYIGIIDDALIEITCEPLNATTVRLRVRVTGMLYSIVTMESGDLMLKGPYPYNRTFEYLVDVRTNHAWMNGIFVGFFPFYVLPPLCYGNITEIAPELTFMNEPLSVPTDCGKPIPLHVHLKLSNRTEVTVIGLELTNDYLDLIFVYHYPIWVECLLPLGDGLYAHVQARIDEPWIPRILRIDDYPPETSCWILPLPSHLLLIAACSAGLPAFTIIVKINARGRATGTR